MKYSGNIFEPGSTVNVLGNNNFIAQDATGITILGDNNRVHSGCKNVSIINSSGVTVMGGCQNVSVHNSSGTIINNSSAFYINGLKHTTEKKRITRISDTTVAAPPSNYDYYLTADDNCVICDATLNNITIHLPPASGQGYDALGTLWAVDLIGIIYNIKRIDGTANTVKIVSNGETINNNLPANPLYVASDESFEIRSDGSNWWIT